MALVKKVNVYEAFIEGAIEKTAKLKALITDKGAKTLIEIDGGVNDKTGKRLLDAGADALVAGSYVFKSDNPSATIDI